jgi:hypothetical protein
MDEGKVSGKPENVKVIQIIKCERGDNEIDIIGLADDGNLYEYFWITGKWWAWKNE